MENNKKNFIKLGLLIAVVIVAILSSYFAWGNKQKEQNVQEISSVPADWQTYRNEKYGFEFKYPSEYLIKTSSGKSFESPDKESLSIVLTDQEGSNYFLSLEMNGGPYGFEIWNQISNEKKQINGIEMNRQVFVDTDINLTHIFYDFKNTDNWFIVFSRQKGLENPETEAIYEQIVSTFKFTK